MHSLRICRLDVIVEQVTTVSYVKNLRNECISSPLSASHCDGKRVVSNVRWNNNLETSHTSLRIQVRVEKSRKWEMILAQENET